MNIIAQFRAFNEINSHEPLPMDAQGLYYNILNLFNLNRWPETLVIKTQDLEHSCNISRKRVCAARNVLVTKNFIKYEKANRASGSPEYALVFLYETHSNKPVFPYETHKGTHNPQNDDYVFHNETHGVSIGNTQPDETQQEQGIQSPLKHNKLLIDTNSKHVNITEPKGSGKKEVSNKPPKEERKKSSAQKKKEGKVSTPHWEKLVELWFEFNIQKKGLKPSFKGSDPRDLKQILTNLQKRSESEGIEWTEETALNIFGLFLSTAIRGNWLKDNFLLSNINRQFDKILSYAKEQRGGIEESVDDLLDKFG